MIVGQVLSDHYRTVPHVADAYRGANRLRLDECFDVAELRGEPGSSRIVDEYEKLQPGAVSLQRDPAGDLTFRVARKHFHIIRGQGRSLRAVTRLYGHNHVYGDVAGWVRLLLLLLLLLLR